MKKLLSFLVLSFLLGGCSFFGKSSDYSYETPMMEEYYAVESESSGGYADESYRSTTSDSIVVDDSGYVEGVEQKVIKTGDLSLHVQDVRETADTIKNMVEDWGGDVSSSDITRYDTSYWGYLTLRVPSDQFDTAMEALKELAIYVNSETTNAQNITEAYMDLEARLTALEAEEAQYLEILDKATTVEEILQVTDYLSSVRYEIESVEGQLKYYDSNVDYSTIYLTLTEDESVSVTTETWDPWGTVQNATSDWIGFLQRIVDRIIYVLIFAGPFLLVAALVVLWVRRKK